MASTAKRRSLLVIGVMSGTSTDGISAALVRLEAHRRGYRHALLQLCTLPFAPQLRSRLLNCAEGARLPASHLSVLNVELGEAIAQTANHAARQAGVPLSRVDLIGSHGHTIFHGPARSARSQTPSTLQIGEPAVVAARTGVTTVADFRTADVAVGGQGAPLAPYVHWLLFTDRQRGRSIHNLGGIANLTYLPPAAKPEQIIAFDTGPGNMVIDALVTHFTNGRSKFDRDGRTAARGSVSQSLLDELLKHPYFRRSPPKSTGREEFGAEFGAALLNRARRLRLGSDDIVATATALTARSIAGAYKRFVLPRRRLDAIYFAGGGARNRTLLRMIGEALPGPTISPIDALGVTSESMEALAFAVLACEAVRGRCANVPAVTGASRRVILGKIVPGAPEQWRRTMRKFDSSKTGW